jgi:hypothetical protein
MVVSLLHLQGSLNLEYPIYAFIHSLLSSSSGKKSARFTHQRISSLISTLPPSSRFSALRTLALMGTR